MSHYLSPWRPRLIDVRATVERSIYCPPVGAELSGLDPNATGQDGAAIAHHWLASAVVPLHRRSADESAVNVIVGLGNFSVNIDQESPATTGRHEYPRQWPGLSDCA
jgi:hypothetical protein